MDFEVIVEHTLDRIRRMVKIEERPWGAEGCVIELTKQIGDLAKCVMIREGYYFNGHPLNESGTQLASTVEDELADIMYVVIRLANHYGIDLAEEQLKARMKEDEFLKRHGL
jgi:NTP pyrophosphatase (non-canonical NTP hydrolase)